MEIVSVGEINNNLIISIAISKDCFLEKVYPGTIVSIDNLTKEDVLIELAKQIKVSTDKIS